MLRVRLLVFVHKRVEVLHRLEPARLERAEHEERRRGEVRRADGNARVPVEAPRQQAPVERVARRRRELLERLEAAQDRSF